MVELNNLRIVYHIEEGIDTALDIALEEAAKKHGWEWWASGCDWTTGERDLAFDRTRIRVEPSGRELPKPHNHEKWQRERVRMAAFFEKKKEARDE